MYSNSENVPVVWEFVRLHDLKDWASPIDFKGIAPFWVVATINPMTVTVEDGEGDSRTFGEWEYEYSQATVRGSNFNQTWSDLMGTNTSTPVDDRTENDRIDV